MALVMAKDRLISIPDQFYGFSQFPGCQCEHNLNRNIFSAAKGTASVGVDHAHSVFGEFERMGNLMPIIMRPLSGCLNDHSVLCVDIGQARLWLQIRVLL